jgi:hypothetical protein
MVVKCIIFKERVMEFRIGNWVECNGNPFIKFNGVKQIIDTKLEYLDYTYYLVENQWLSANQLKCWKPEIGEYCWNTENKTLGYVKQITNEEYHSYYYFFSNMNGVESYAAYTLDRFEPFIGSLPSFVQTKEVK